MTVNRTPLLEFTARDRFRFNLHNCSPRAEQTGRGGGHFYTSSQLFLTRAILPNPGQFRVVREQAEIKCLDRKDWATGRYHGRRVLFLLPSQALGSNVATLLFLKSFQRRHKPRAMGVFCARSAADIYLIDRKIKVYSLWIGRKDLKSWDMVIDLGHLESRRNVDIWPVDMEAELLSAFSLPPCEEDYPSAPRQIVNPRPAIGIFPLATSPLRTLPFTATIALARGLCETGAVTVYLNRDQGQGKAYLAALKGKLPENVTIVEGLPSIGALMEAVRDTDYGVFADSGPAHMSKLFATPGTAIYTSAPGDILQGRFTNLRRWTVPYKGDHCAAPCGLAKLRLSRDGRIGCMGSLKCSLQDLPGLPSGPHGDIARQLLEKPVPCVRLLSDKPEEAVAFIRDDLQARLQGR